MKRLSLWCILLERERSHDGRISEEPEGKKPVRPSHQKVIEQVERWANSPGLQPPRTEDEKTI